MPLNPEFKAKTVAALRGGDYRQIRHSIGHFRTKALCCIGVAAHANGLSDASDTPEAASFLGLDQIEQDQWVDWNDNKRLGFCEIADLIEAEY